MINFSSDFLISSITFKFFPGRYLLDINKNLEEVEDPNKEAVIDHWVEWESTSLQVSGISCKFY